ncbi:unnamed protein product [Moneuplotes crassus]|uniref:Uncharacterized protein n=1 Tax=Euplotes crassus TaxID=5936 RepID=A0AAD1U8C1_EUPCR|nr:unnamed protein product [Moneuplotes crassus]
MGQEFKHGGFLVNKGSVSSNFGLNPLPIRQSAFVPNKNHFLYRNPIHSNCLVEDNQGDLDPTMERNAVKITSDSSESRDSDTQPIIFKTLNISLKKSIQDSSTTKSQSLRSDEEPKNDENTEITYQDKSSSKFDKGMRFSKRNDKELFKILNAICKEHGVSVTNFWKDSAPLPRREKSILIALADKICWKRNRKLDLLKRIRRIATKKTFSVREKKLLKKIISKNSKLHLLIAGGCNNQILSEIQGTQEILENFPGKSLERCFEEYLTLL